jgi:hypothetical protein
MNEDQRDGMRFAEIVLGVQISDDQPPPGSKLARIIELEQKCSAEGVSEAEFRRRAADL